MKVQTGDPGVTRAYLGDDVEARAAGDPGTPIKFVASTSGVKRDGLDLKLDGLDVANFEKNPVFLWAHNYAMPPIGKVTRINKLKNRIDMWVQFDQGDDFAIDIERKYREGFLTAVSIGWIITEYERAMEDAEAEYIVTGSDLIDLSAVPVPGDADALMPRELAAIRSMASNRSPVEDDDELPAQGSESSAGCEHLDSEGEVDWRGVATGMVRLLDAGTGTPDEDREQQHRHLTRHYRKMGRTAPELLPGIILDDIDVRQLFVEGEWDAYQQEKRMDAEQGLREAAEAMRDAADNFLATLEEPVVDETETENRSFIDALGSIRDAIVLPEEEGETDG